MLRINKLRYKNILSAGNVWIEIAFNDAKTLLATGTNGSGKSTILSALVFCLYGKDFRGIKKGGLINSVNKKNLVTECEFDSGGKSYKIVRGVKPDILDVYEDGKLLPQESKPAMQKTIENEILRFPYDSFKQIVATGSGQYVPFMKLKALQRREFIDNFLEIDVFTKMKAVLKIKNDLLTEQVRDAKKQVEILTEKIKYAKDIQERKEGEDLAKRMDYVHELKKLAAEIEELQPRREKAVEGLNIANEKLEKFVLIERAISTIDGNITSINSSKSKLESKSKNIEHIINCPTCFQKVTEDHKKKIKAENITEIDELNESIKPFDEKRKKLADALVKKAATVKAVSDINTLISEIDRKISSKNSSIAHYNSLIAELDNNKGQITDDIGELQETLNEKNAILNKKSEDKSLHDYAALLLKDDGIKSVIIKKYVEILNQLINGYLAKFDFYVNFSFDENFDETIKSRYRDEFSYENFSEGEKARIDLSILFAFRSMAKMRSNLDCSLLIIDELLDSAIDANGIDDVRTIFNLFDDLNVFVISHREKASELFDKTMEFKKVGHFSQMEIIG
jgi:DNA repair exonuclease SbcCD ATPase subunit